MAINEEPKTEMMERKPARRPVGQNESRFRDAFDHAPIGMALTDLSGQCMEVNRAFCGVLGYTEVELLGMDLRSVVHADDRAFILEGFRGLLTGEGGLFSSDKRFVHQNGRIVWVNMSATVVRSLEGDPLYCIVQMQDTTQRKRAQDELKEQKEILQRIFDHVPLMINLTGSDGRVRLVNKQWEQALGWTLAEMQEQKVDLPAECHPDSAQRDRDLKFVGEENAPWLNFKMETKDGGMIDTSWRTFSFSDGTAIGFGQDVTERKGCEDALRQARERAESVLEGMADTYIFFDRQWRYVHVSEAAVRAMGRPREEILGRTLWELYPDIVGSELDRQYHRAMNERVAVAFEFHYLTTDTWWENRFFPAPGGLAVFATDITDRKKAEQKARESQDLFTVFMENLPGFAWMKDVQGRYVYANRMMEQLYPFRADCIGKTDAQIWPPEIASHYRNYDQTVIARRTAIQVVEPYLVNGELRHLFGSKFPILDAAGNVSLVGGISIDITERKRAEEEILRLNAEMQARLEELNTLLDILPVGVCIGNRDCSQITANPAVYRLLGFAPDTNASLTHRGLEMPEDLRILVGGLEVGSVDTPMRQVARSGKPLYNLEHELIFRDGTRKSVYASIAPLFDQKGSVRKVIGAYSDFTERKKAEGVLADYARRLQSLSGRLLKAQESERRRIARELHDEVGQSLTAIKIQLRAVQGNSKDSGSTLKECIGVVDQILAQTKNLSLNLHPPQLDELGLIAALRWHLDRQAYAADLIPRFSADSLPARLQPGLEIACFRVAQEAITNVIRHAGASWISVRLSLHDDELHLVIQDDGRGFETEDAQNQGRSLGLVGMRERVELVNGRLELRSSPGRGTEVHAVFPWPMMIEDTDL